jgi:hypothetical protein
MDHLPSVDNPYLPPVEAEYLLDRYPSNPPYQPGFWEFPRRCNWDADEFKKGNFEQARVESSSGAAACFLQQWLFFGLLSAFLGDSHDMAQLEQDFTRLRSDADKTTRLITTAKLPQYLDQWRDSLTTTQEQSGSTVELELNRLLGEVQPHVAGYMCHGGAKTAASPLTAYPEISLSIIILGSH